MALWSALFPKPVGTPLQTRPSLTLFFLLAGAFLLTLVPHVVQFPLWVSITVAGAMVLRSVLELYRLPLPSTGFCGFVALVLLSLIYVQFGTLEGRNAGTAFTAGLLAIKFYELRGPRDVALIIFSCFFVVMSALLYSQVLELFIYCLIMMWVLTALLLRVQAGDLPHDRLIRMLTRSGVIFLQALPLTVFLFFVFPRYTGLLSFSLDEAKIGLTDTVTPGSIAKLALDDSPALYVQFTSKNIPSAEQMYWRALVLWDYKNGTWTPGSIAAMPKFEASAPSAAEVDQEITVYQHNQKWLFALDVPIGAPKNTEEVPGWGVFLNGDVIQLQNKLNHMTRYQVKSSTAPAEEPITNTERSHGVELPSSPTDHIDPRVTALADELHRDVSDEEYINKVLQYFQHGSFVYSTAPGVQGSDWLPVFLFKTKTGFCEHFASAFAVLMRLEKIPTRLVVGYAGADYNPYSDKYIVSQSNAHAWDEVWVRAANQPSTGTLGHWRREDPTAVAGAGSAAANSGEVGDTLASQVAHHRRSFFEEYLPPWVEASLKEMQLRREQVEAGWDNLVFSYDPEVQSRWAQILGLGERARVTLLLVCLVVSGLCLIIFQKWMARPPAASPVETLYAAFCRNMARRGIPRAAWEGPLAYTERVAEAFPDDKLTIQHVGSIVARARYGPVPADAATPHDLKSLLTLLTASQAAAAARERQ